MTMYEPLAARLRPQKLDDIYGQKHILGPGMLLRRMVEGDMLSSIILYGPPGTQEHFRWQSMRFWPWNV